MGNLRQKYTDEEWDALQDRAKRSRDFERERKEEEREKRNELYDRLQRGRDYLMQTENITVADALEAFGFGRNGLGE